MIGPLRRLSIRAFSHAMEHNLRNIELALEPENSADFLDLGCDDGERTMRLAGVAGARTAHGIELIPERAAQARERGVRAVVADLAEPLPFEEESFDVVVSNQVIEHLVSPDRFLDEIHRVLRPGGYAVTSTENLSSWHNIAATILGWQPFSLTNVSVSKSGLGNPLAVHRGFESSTPGSWCHLVVFSYRGLKEIFESHGFEVEAVHGAGYYPLPSAAARFDPRHAAFLTVKARKAVSYGTGSPSGPKPIRDSASSNTVFQSKRRE